MIEEKIQTLHPLSKSGRNINRKKYEALKKAIFLILRNKELTHNELFAELNKSLKGKFSGSLIWKLEKL